MDYRRPALLVTTLAGFLIPFMGSSVNIALPTIGKEFSMDAILLSWITLSFVLTSAMFLVPFGRIGDIHGRKRVFLHGFVIYTLSSLFSAIHVVNKLVEAGNTRILLTERGSTFGYNNLVVDMRSLPMMRELGYPVVFDVTHSLQLPGAGDGVTAGLAEYIQPLAQAGVGAGIDGVFMEVHENPPQAKSDAANALKLDLVEPLLRRLVAIDRIVARG